MGLNIWPFVGGYLDYFTDPTYMKLLLVNLERVDKLTKSYIIKFIRRVDATTDAFDESIVVDLVERITYETGGVAVFEVHQGEDLCINVTLETGQDFTGSVLVVRNAKDNSILSPTNTAGSADPIQTVKVTDIALAPATAGVGGFYLLNVNLEVPDGSGNTTGDVTTLLQDVFLLILPNADAA